MNCKRQLFFFFFFSRNLTGVTGLASTHAIGCFFTYMYLQNPFEARGKIFADARRLISFFPIQMSAFCFSNGEFRCQKVYLPTRPCACYFQVFIIATASTTLLIFKTTSLRVYTDKIYMYFNTRAKCHVCLLR